MDDGYSAESFLGATAALLVATQVRLQLPILEIILSPNFIQILPILVMESLNLVTLYPGVYANVKHFTNWVEQTVNYYKNNVEAEEVIEEEIVEEADTVNYLGNLPYVKDILNYTNSLFKRMFVFGQ